MNKVVFLLTVLLACVASAEEAVAVAPRVDFDEPRPVEPRNYYGKVAKRLGDMLPRFHVSQHPLDDDMSQRAWTNLVSFYDFDHSVFLKGDLDRLAMRMNRLDDELRASDVSFGFDVHRLYVERLRERMVFVTNLLAKADWDFGAVETFRSRRKDAPWPASREEAEEHWRKRIKNEVLSQLLTAELEADDRRKRRQAAGDGDMADAAAFDAAGEATASNALAAASSVATNAPAATNLAEIASSLYKKYRQYYNVLTEPDEEAVLQHYLSAVCRAFDPHSDYMSPASKEDFDMEMNLSLCGVGAVLSMDDGALKIVEIMPGGPVDRDGRIREGDKIVGVRQGDGEMEDVMWQPMKKSIGKIRGPKGTRVTLNIMPRSDPSGATRRAIELVRDEIKLEDQAATGRVETVVYEGGTNRLGYVYLPAFYGTMDKRPNEDGFRSCAMDVNRYLADFNAAGVEGLVLDLRGNGGGSLREAVLLSALFVASGPVVQIRDIRTTGCLPIPQANPIAFRKPMVVLIDRASASASEIVAGHLRDTGRAVILGDIRTHGKGTVQTVMGMGPDKYGSTKITTARFYRIDGRSTQVEGVAADVHLPSLLDSLDIGEDKLTYALPFSRIAPADYMPSWNLDTYVDVLRRLSLSRLAESDRYAKHLASVMGMKEISEREEVPLEREARKRLMSADRNLRELDETEAEAAESVAGDDPIVPSKGDGTDKSDRSPSTRRRRNERPKDDIVLDEAFLVLSDLLRLNGGAEMPRIKNDWYNTLLRF